MQTSVTNITRDIISTINPNIPDRKMVTISRVLSAVLMTIALLMCLVWTDTLNWLTNTYAYSAAALACPVFLSYGLRNKHFITTPGIVAGMVFGLADHEDLPELRVYRHSRFRRCYGDRERRHEEEGHDRHGRRVMCPRQIC